MCFQSLTFYSCSRLPLTEVLQVFMPVVQQNVQLTVKLCRSEWRTSRQTRTEFNNENRKVLETHGNHHHPGWAVSTWTIKGGDGARINHWYVKGNETYISSKWPFFHFNLCSDVTFSSINLHLFQGLRWSGSGFLPSGMQRKDSQLSDVQIKTLCLIFLVCMRF